MIPTTLLVTVLVFLVMRILPGNIVAALMPGELLIDPLLVARQKAEIEHELGLDAPLIVQYGRWMGITPQADGSFSGLFQGDFGTSWWRKMPVLGLIALKWPVTLELGILGLIITQLIAWPIGIYSALRQDKWGDYVGRSFAILCVSVPGFWLGTMIIVFPAIWWGYMPPIMLIHFTEDPIGNLRMFIVPALVLGMSMAGVIMRLTRSMMLEVLRQDYIRTAWAKGLHVPILVGGTVIIEQIFCLPGMGRLLITAVERRDCPLANGIMVFIGVSLVVVNLLVDLTYAYLDPRVRYK
ncbi:Glutathione transport system permease protein GsiC [subsurface metagenome]